MQLKWSKEAVNDLGQIRKFIHRNNAAIAKEVALKLAGLAETLLEHPAKGCVGRVPNTRELIVPDLPYLIVYRARGNRIEILRVIHTAENWPK